MKQNTPFMVFIHSQIECVLEKLFSSISLSMQNIFAKSMFTNYAISVHNDQKKKKNETPNRIEKSHFRVYKKSNKKESSSLQKNL